MFKRSRTTSFLLKGLILIILVFFISPLVVRAESARRMSVDKSNLFSEEAAGGDLLSEIVADSAIDACENDPAATLQYSGSPVATDATAVSNAKLIAKCIAAMEEMNGKMINTKNWEIFKKENERELRKERLKEALAGAFKSSLSVFSQQLAKDTATWIASGGKGQKPLFVTEGWGAYVKDIGDAALGDFIDNLGQSYGVDMCRPNLDVQLMIAADIAKTGQDQRVRCTFSTMMTNWDTAIRRADFSIEYTNALRPGENDISVYLMARSRAVSAVTTKINNATEEAKLGDGFLAVKNFVGKVLTPGTTAKEALHRALVDPNNVGKKDGIFTGTIFDFVETFLNTLVGQLLENFKNGLFSDDSSGSRGGSGFSLPNLSVLLNPLASPTTEGARGAAERFAKLQDFSYREIGAYDVLTQLSQCSSGVQDNPAPTECVIDQKLLSAIKEKKQLYQILDGSGDSSGSLGIGDRLFAPAIGATDNLANEIPLRSVIILRKYRIVPVGWEIAANIASRDNRNYTLKEIAANFDNANSQFYKLVDPYWTLKASEAYCRRQGFSGHNENAKSQDGSISRTEYCADEQQCLQQDENGNCKAYGYCSEERPIWSFEKSCEPRYNTCQTFTDPSGKKQSLLANTLDFRNCDASNAGCKWYSLLYDAVTRIWRHTAPNEIISSIPIGATPSELSVTGHEVEKWHQISTDKKLRMSQPCSPAACNGTTSTNCTYNQASGTCTFFAGTCTPAPGSSGCYLEQCLEDTDLLASKNGNFENAGNYSWQPAGWNFDNSTYNINNRIYRIAGEGVPTGSSKSYAIRLTASNAPVVSEDYSTWVALEKVQVEPEKNYELKFNARGNYLSSQNSNGRVVVSIIKGEERQDFPIYSLGNEFREYFWNFNAGAYSEATIRITIKAGTTVDGYFDNFQIRKLKEDCGQNTVWLSTGIDNSTTEASENEVYLTASTPACDGSADGCSQFVRLKPGLGTNLIPVDSGFEQAGLGDWEESSGCATAERSDFKPHSGGYSAKLVSDSTCYLESTLSLGANGNNLPILEAGKRYVLSGWVWSGNEGNNSYQVSLDYGTGTKVATASYGNSDLNNWKRLSVVFDATSTVANPTVRVGIFGAVSNREAYFDDIQLEEVPYNGQTASNYSPLIPSRMPYQQLAYLKKAPDYLNCYRWSDGTWASSDNIYEILSNQSAQCSNYAPVCTVDEVGCQIYAPANGDPAVPGVAETLDLCPQECNGYQVYKQEKTDFASSRFVQFIADRTPKYCSAAYAGCDEFTNLDELGQGAERKEYYVHIKACQKPSTDDGTYYTWEGEDTTGYQLKVYKLKKSQDGSSEPHAPCTNLTYPTDTGSTGVGRCEDPDFNDSQYQKADYGWCSEEEMETNADCRQFYDQAGNITYRLLSKTVTVSDNCHPYRRTPISPALEGYENCIASHGWWNGANECIYMAIPGEGTTCSASVAGCRAYTGNYGNNVRNVLGISTFGQDDFDGWTDAAGVTSTLSISTESTHQGGFSLSNGSAVQVKKEFPVYNNRAYRLSFWAKSDGPVFRFDSIKFSGTSDSSDYFAVSSVGADGDLGLSRPEIKGEWKRFDVGPVFVHWNPADDKQDLQFNLPSGRTVFLDNIQLTEVRDSVYLVENSWFTPVSCDNAIIDPTGADTYQAAQLPGGTMDTDICADTSSGVGTHRCLPGNMLGCKAYRTTGGSTAYLKSFARLCRAEAAGCEELLDTHNYDDPAGAVFNGGDTEEDNWDRVTVPAYEPVYLVNSLKYSCKSQDKGCMAMGLPRINQYDEVTGYNTVYLRNDPDRYATDLCSSDELWCEKFAGNNSLYYFKDPGRKLCEFKTVNNRAWWYKVGTDELCAITYDQTFGTGYEALSNKTQPIGPYDNLTGGERTIDVNNNSFNYPGWAGTCPDNRNGCSEFVDPISDIYPDLNYQDRATLKLDANYLYTVDNGATVTTTANSAGCDIYYPFGDDNSKANFYVKSPNYGSSTCEISILPRTAKVARAGVYYALATNLDRSSCNGLVDYKIGCVLFNDRSSVNYQYTGDDAQEVLKERNKYFNFNAATTYDIYQTQQKQPMMANTSAPKDSSALLKVLPDRTCKDWLYCTTYQRDEGSASTTNSDFRFQSSDTCLRFGVCEKMDYDTGTCVYSPDTEGKAEVSKESFNFQYLTGYSTPGFLPFENMEQIGSSASVANGNFETVIGGTSEPIGWIMSASTTALDASGWTSSKYAVESDYRYRQQDTGYLRLNGAYETKSEPIDVERGERYYLSGWINTLDLVTEGAKGEIWIFDGDCNESDSPSLGKVGLQAGLPWTKLTKMVTSSRDTICLKLINYKNPVVRRNCNDLTTSTVDASPVRWSPNYSTACDISGSALFDDITLRPVLNPVEKTVIDGRLDVDATSTIPRSCRLYPAQDALSCSYTKDGRFYYGQYGYCLASDPRNPQVCLQWWPVDQLKGDVVDEYSAGYADRAPLYYCVNPKKVKIDMKAGGNLVGTGGGVSDLANMPGAGPLLAALLGDDNVGKFTPFDITPNATPLFRYPFLSNPINNATQSLSRGISRLSGGTASNDFSFGGLIVGVGTAYGHVGFGGNVLSFRMSPKNTSWLGLERDSLLQIIINIIINPFNVVEFIAGEGSGLLPKNDWWGGWGIDTPVWFGDGGGFALPLPTSWSAVENAIMGGGSSATSVWEGAAEWLDGVGGEGTKAGAKIVTDQDPKYAGIFKDPNPDIPGDILGLAWNVKGGNAALVVFMFGDAFGSLDLYYCDKIVQVVTPSGRNKAWVSRIGQGSQFNFQTSDKDFAGDVGTFFNNPYGLKGLDSITSSSTCVAAGNSWDEVTGKCYYENMRPSSLGYKFDGYDADYNPFGSMVPPAADFQNPELWDTRDGGADTTRQPILWQAPSLTGSLPYQPRMGQPITEAALKNLFARSYRIWEWQELDGWDDGYYKEVEDNWDLPANCAPSVEPDSRDANQRSSTTCRILPQIGNVNVAATGQTVRLSFTVKVDKDQLPLTSYTIYWDDGTTDSVAGVKLRSRMNSESPFVMYHYYDDNDGGDSSYSINIKVKDNWNAANNVTVNSGTITPLNR